MTGTQPGLVQPTLVPHRVTALVEPEHIDESAYRTIVDSVAQLMWVNDAAGGVRFFNRFALEYIGRTNAELEGRGWLAFLHDADREPIAAARDAAIADGRAYSVDGRFRRHDGDYRWQCFDVQPVRDAGGGIIAWIGTARDVHDERLREREREQLLAGVSSERALFRAVYEQLPAGLTIVEAPSGRILHFNREGERLLGHPVLPSDDVGDYARYGARHSDDTPYTSLEYPTARALKGETLVGEPMIYRRGDGRTAMLRISAAPIRDAAHTMTHAVCTWVDVTAQHDAERALAERGERLQRLNRVTVALAGAPDVAAIAGVIADAGIGALGATASRLALLRDDGRTLELCGPETTAGEYTAAWRTFPLDAPVPMATAVRTGEPLWVDSLGELVAQFPAVRTELTQLGFHAVAVLPLTWAGRRLGGVSFNFPAARAFDTDTRAFLETLARQCAQALERARLFQLEQRARKDAEAARAEAQRANVAKGDFLAMMSHDLRTPINATLGYVDLMAMEIRGPLTAEQRHDLERMRRSQRALLALVNEVLDYTRVEAGRAECRRDPLRLADVIGDVAPIVEALAAQKSLRFEPSPVPDVVATGDADRVRQVLLNLLSNAVKFTDAGGTVRLTSEADGATVRLHVTDTGRGIAPHELASVFDPFVQVDRDRDATTREGVGLGLAIARELARAMGGDLTAESALGAGSTFTLALPRG